MSKLREWADAAVVVGGAGALVVFMLALKLRWFLLACIVSYVVVRAL